MIAYVSSLALELHLALHVTTKNIEPVIIENAGSALPSGDYLVRELCPETPQHQGFVLNLLGYLQGIRLLVRDARLISVAPN